MPPKNKVTENNVDHEWVYHKCGFYNLKFRGFSVKNNVVSVTLYIYCWVVRCTELNENYRWHEKPWEDQEQVHLAIYKKSPFKCYFLKCIPGSLYLFSSPLIFIIHSLSHFHLLSLSLYSLLLSHFIT